MRGSTIVLIMHKSALSHSSWWWVHKGKKTPTPRCVPKAYGIPHRIQNSNTEKHLFANHWDTLHSNETHSPISLFTNVYYIIFFHVININIILGLPMLPPMLLPHHNQWSQREKKNKRKNWTNDDLLHVESPIIVAVASHHSPSHHQFHNIYEAFDGFLMYFYARDTSLS